MDSSKWTLQDEEAAYNVGVHHPCEDGKPEGNKVPAGPFAVDVDTLDMTVGEARNDGRVDDNLQMNGKITFKHRHSSLPDLPHLLQNSQVCAALQSPSTSGGLQSLVTPLDQGGITDLPTTVVYFPKHGIFTMELEAGPEDIYPNDLSEYEDNSSDSLDSDSNSDCYLADSEDSSKDSRSSNKDLTSAQRWPDFL